MPHRARGWIGCWALAAALLLAPSLAVGYDWLQFNGDAAHSGNNPLESRINVNNVAQLAFRFQVSLGDVEDGAPVFLDSVSTPAGVQSLLFVTTRSGYIIALNANTGAQVWSHQNGPGNCKINNGGSACYTTSSPVIDPDRQYVYSYGLDGRVHKYAVGNGTEVVGGGWPEPTTLKAFDEKASSPLAFATVSGTTYLYVVHGGYPGDAGDYQGHLTAINLSTGAEKVFNAMCSDQAVAFVETPGAPDCAGTGSAIWGRPSAVYDAGTGLLFVATGNSTGGTWDGMKYWSESMLAVNPDGTGTAAGPLDSYTPADYQNLDNRDADLGSTSPAILPVPANSAVAHLAVQGGKDAQLRLVNLANLSGKGAPGHTGGEVATPMRIPQGGELLAQPAVWVNPADGTTWVFVGNSGGLSGLKLSFDSGGHPSLVAQWQLSSQQAQSSPLLANNVLFFFGPTTAGGQLSAYSPTTGSLLWTTNMVGGTHWESPIVANGMVYVTDENGMLTAFGVSGVSPTTTTLQSSQNPSTAGTSVTFTATVAGSAPTGEVAFSADGSTIAGCNAVALSAASAACTTSGLAVGGHSILASYGGDANNAASTSSALQQTVNSASSVNVALAANGGVASASSTIVFPGYSFPVAAVNDGDRSGVNWGHGGGWNSATANAFPDWVQINFSGSQTIDQVIVYTLQDNYLAPVDPPANMTFSLYGITAFQVQGWNGTAWVNLGAAVSGNNLVKRPVGFAAYTTNRIRVNITAALDSYARVVEIEAWTSSGGGGGGGVATTTTLSSSPNPSVKHRNVTFSANVTGNNPTGTVSFSSGGTAIAACAAVAVSGGAATCTTASLSIGTHSIVASYSGDAANQASSSAPLSQVVNPGH